MAILSFPTGTIIYSQTGGTVSSDGAGNTVITYNSSGTFSVICSPLTLTLSPSSPAFCIGGSTTVTASGASTYTWAPSTGLSATSGASVIANPATTTVYTVSGTSSGGCTGTQTVVVTVNPLPIITTSPAAPVVLGSQGATITASGASTYTWSPSTNLNTTTGATVTATPQITKSYTITGTSSAGCVSSSAVSVAVELWQQTADTLNAPIYYGGKLGIGTTNPQAALDVTGNTKISGVLTSSNINVSSFSGISGGGFVTVDSLGNLKINPITGGTATVTPCGTNIPWMIGGNMLGSGGGTLGTCNGHDLIMKASGTNYLWLKTNGRLGIGTSSPNAKLDIYVPDTNTVGFNIGNTYYSNIFNVAANGYIGIGNNTPAAQLDIFVFGTNAAFNINGNGTGSIFNVANDGSLGVGGNTSMNGSLTVGGSTSINGNTSIGGSLTIPTIKNTKAGAYSTVLVDSAGKLVSGAAVASTNSTAWVLGGNGTNASAITSSIGTTDTNDLPIVTNNQERMRINAAGVLTLTSYSLSTASANRSLSVDQNGKVIADIPGASGSGWLLGGNSNTGTNNILGTTDSTDLVLAAGNAGTPGVGANRVRFDHVLGNIGIGPDFFIGKNPTALLDLGINSIHGSATPTPFAIRDFNLSTTAHSWNNTLLEVNNIGHIYMGTTRPSNSTYTVALLTVSGTIVAKEIFVATTDAGWADYVFKKDYKLMPLKEVEKYISTNQHLPNVPSAAEVETKGQNLGTLQIKQMEKTEELYLYIIEMNKKLEKLEEQNKKLADEVNNLKKNKQ